MARAPAAPRPAVASASAAAACATWPRRARRYARIIPRSAASNCASPTPAPPRGGAADHPPAAPGADDFSAFEVFVVASQDRILREAERLDGSGRVFLRDRWERPEGAGYGVTAVLEGGDLFEKAAANVTVVCGALSPQRAQAMSGRGRAAVDPRGGQRYAAAALSLVFHPRHPHVPTLRADVRLFQVFADGKDEGRAGGAANGGGGGGGSGGVSGGAGRGPALSWYGGGCDLTPALLHEADARYFHAHWKAVCDGHLPGAGGGGGGGGNSGDGGGLYSELKPWCDRYFYVSARREHRGVGGIFFDDLERGGGHGDGAGTEEGHEGGAGREGSSSSGSGSGISNPPPSSPATATETPCGAPASAAAARRGEFDPAAFARDVLANVLPSWSDIAARRRALPCTEAERAWQLKRRGRYVEFNLLDDRGVRFGLADGRGRVESIMVSAPPLVAWAGYGGAPPAPGTREAATLELLQGAPREWV